MLLLLGCGTTAFSQDRIPKRRQQLAGAGRLRGNLQEDLPAPPATTKKPLYDDSDVDVDEIQIPNYPRDPVWPTWTPIDDPAKQPIFAPAGYYDLVRPPDGISPTEDDQEYNRLVTSEDDLFFHEASCQPAIDLCRPDGMAPAGIFGDHTLNAGGRVLLSYRFNLAPLNGLLNGTHSVSTAAALNSFPIVPVRETAINHYFLMEWAPTDDLTFLSILPIVQRNIKYVDGAGNHQATDMTDLSDIQLYALYVLQQWDHQQIHLNLGVQIPTGVFVEQGVVISPTSPALTYPMRSSDGTWDFLPGITYRGQSNLWTWGVQGLGIVRLGINKFNYRLGDEGDFNGWVSRKLDDWVSVSARLNGHVSGNIFGADPQLNPNLVPTNRTNLQAGQSVNLLFGLNFMIPEGVLRGQRLGIEGGIPLYQSLSGPQLQQTYQIWANLSVMF